MESAAKKKRTRRECFLDQVEAATPWARLVEQIEPFYPKGERGRPLIGIERMLLTYIVQQGEESVAHADAGYVGLEKCEGMQGRKNPLFDIAKERSPRC